MKLTEIKHLRESTQPDDLKIIEILRYLGLDSNEYTVDARGVNVYSTIAFNDNINIYLEDGSLPFQIAVCDKDVHVVDVVINDCKNFPLRAISNLYVMRCPELKSLEGITPKIEGSLLFYDLPGIKSFVGIHEHFEYIKGEFVFNDAVIDRGGIGLILIPKLTSFRAYGVSTLTIPFHIIAKYVGRPDDIFKCQAELIEAGFEEYAEL